ncbi:glycosyltransferase [Nubsella zeaxanthinifaciens]|uniref:glycosyltransferase n=1 Tax=Nubsella zeaxanthinifaciens TaxID=392412 RepID=UPI000DE569B9|nr:glycosyltransferase [Nubsella zeaxanthinifaciens]
MTNLIITSGNSRNYNQIENFISSLRKNANYDGLIAVCDNEISGEWDKPGTWLREGSFTQEQTGTIKSWGAQIFTLQDLISNNEVDEHIIESIKSPTQRYPYKFIYNCLISKHYLNKVDAVLYFDSDVYFQKNIDPIFDVIALEKINVVKEFNKIKDNYYLNNWIKYSNFDKLSSQEHYLSTMLNADNYCTGFYGGGITAFHNFNLLALLITSNKFINFYSDQPLFNILTSFFNYPINEISYENCLHIGELEETAYTWQNKYVSYKNIVPISVHLNGGRYNELVKAMNGEKVLPPKKDLIKKIKSIIRKVIKR